MPKRLQAERVAQLERRSAYRQVRPATADILAKFGLPAAAKAADLAAAVGLTPVELREYLSRRVRS